MFILAWSLLRNFTESLIWAFLGGIVLDILATSPFGIFTVSLLIMATLANFWHERLFRSSFILPVLLALPYSILFNLCGLVFMQLLDYNLNWGSALRNIVFPAGLMNVIAMAFIFPLLSWLNNFIEREGLTIENWPKPLYLGEC